MSPAMPTLRDRRPVVHLAAALALAAATGCPPPNPPADVPDTDASDAGEPACPVFEDDPAAPTWCSLGTDVPGATVPAGFCLRRYASVGSARRLAVACNGDLFVSAPSASAPGGSGGGPGGVVLLVDDNRDGTAEATMFASRVPDVHGLAVGGGAVWWTTQASVFRTPYTLGQRAERAGARQNLAMPARWAGGDQGRWTHGLTRSAGGQLLGSAAAYGACGDPIVGEVSRVGQGSLEPIATGFRNPMYLRCHYRDEVCLAAELGEDQRTGAREKLVRVRPSTEYGFPCCHTTGVTYASASTPARCDAVTREEFEFVLGDTPFGFDWERGAWPTPYAGGLFVALHGSYYTIPRWQGAGIVYLPTDPTTHLPVEQAPTPAPPTVTTRPRYFVEGFGPEGGPLERPSDIAFAPDGRMFFSDDLGGAVYWIAPTSLRQMRAR